MHGRGGDRSLGASSYDCLAPGGRIPSRSPASGSYYPSRPYSSHSPHIWGMTGPHAATCQHWVALFASALSWGSRPRRLLRLASAHILPHLCFCQYLPWLLSMPWRHTLPSQDRCSCSIIDPCVDRVDHSECLLYHVYGPLGQPGGRHAHANSPPACPCAFPIVRTTGILATTRRSARPDRRRLLSTDDLGRMSSVLAVFTR